jgi:hypothetical protein
MSILNFNTDDRVIISTDEVRVSSHYGLLVYSRLASQAMSAK